MKLAIRKNTPVSPLLAVKGYFIVIFEKRVVFTMFPKSIKKQRLDVWLFTVISKVTLHFTPCIQSFSAGFGC